MEAPGKRAIVDRAAAGLIAVIQNRERLRLGFCIRAPSHRLALRTGTQFLALEVTQFVERAEILGSEARAAFEANHFHTRFAEFGGEDSTDCAYTQDDDVSFFSSHGLLHAP